MTINGKVSELLISTDSLQKNRSPNVKSLVEKWWTCQGANILVVIAIYFIYVTSSVEIAICFRMFQANNSTHILAAKISTSWRFFVNTNIRTHSTSKNWYFLMIVISGTCRIHWAFSPLSAACIVDVNNLQRVNK